jgi:hypothetical protein
MELFIKDHVNNHLIPDLTNIVYEFTNDLSKFGDIFGGKITDLKSADKLIALLETDDYNTIRTGLLANNRELLNFSKSKELQCFVKSNENGSFQWSCASGYLEVAKWLYSISRIYAYDDDDYAFRLSCRNGYLEVAQWLYSIGGIDIHARDDYAFRWSCLYGHLDVAKWLYSLGGIDMHTRDDFAFRWSCENGYLKIAQWLYSIGGIDIHAIDDYAFRHSPRHILDWFNTL